MAHIISNENRKQLVELYRHLDRTGVMGDKQISYYGQLRAQEYSHAEALEMTIEFFGLRKLEWYLGRFPITPLI